jgi:secretion/DNA translocation related TadE-like protein
MARRDERGSATVLVIAAVGVVLTLALATTVLAGYLLAFHRARQAADLAAVSGAARAASGQPGCPAAERIARANGVARVVCDHVGDHVEYVVSVEVHVSVRPAIRGLPADVPARSDAGHLQ